jgi:general secretion pathway protein D
MRTFYLSNTVQPQELTEIVTGLRQLLDLKRIQQLNGQNAIVMRDTPAKIALAEKFINDVDKAKPEVVIQVQVLQASTNRLRTLGILPGQSASIQINPYNCANTSSGCSSSSSSSSSNNTVTLNNLKHLNSSDYTVTLPSLTANAVLTDSDTRIIQSPEVRIVDGMIAKLKVGDRVPVATGSYSAGTSVNSSANLNSLISTQFQYIDVGVNLDITPRVHPNGEVSLKIAVEVSSVTNYVTIGGIQQPVISQRKIEHDIRLKEGETNILGGLFQRTDTKSLNGWPGLAKIPMMRYLFSSDSKDSQENDVLIVLTPHIIRNPEWTDDNLKPVSTGSETNIAVHREHALSAPSQTTLAGATSTAEGSSLNQTPAPEPSAHLKVAPSSAEMKVGETQIFSIAVDRVTDLFSIPLLIKYDSNVIHIEDVQNGGFLSGETQELAIVQRNDAERGEMMVSAVRQPHTPGVGGSGVVFTLVVKAIGAGTSQIAVVQVNAKNSNQKTILLATHDASIHARP